MCEKRVERRTRRLLLRQQSQGGGYSTCAWLEQNHLWRIAAVLINLCFVLHAHRRPPPPLLLLLLLLLRA
jgi:hypothetical protein